ncbi:unnamed protein product [Aphanomyces euteiches]
MMRVLLIDDEEDALDLLEILLKQIGGVEVVRRYNNPVQAIENIVRFPVDAVFMDNQMPGMKGTEAARAIREKLPQIPIVFTTAYAEYAVEAFEIQSTDYLLKPFTKERLQNAVERIQQSLSVSSLEARRNTGTPFSIRCLEGFHIQLPDNGERMLAWKTKKEKELCAYLIHHEGKSVNTASIIEALWPGYNLEKAKIYLYTCMSYLRKSLAENDIPIQIHKADQGFYAALDGVTVDVTEFEHLLQIVLTEELVNERLYDQINLIYKGEYMAACDFGWAVARQMEIKAMYIRVLRKWCAHFRSQDQMALAVDSMKRVLTLAPDSEADGRELIQLHLEAGNRNEALRVCLQLEQAVRVQLGAELEEGTVLLLHQLKDQAEWLARGVQ